MQAACIRWEVFRPAADGQNGMAVTGMCCGLTSKESGGNPGVRHGVSAVPAICTADMGMTIPVIMQGIIPALISSPVMTVLHCMICMLIITSIMRPTAGTIWMVTVTTAAGTAEQRGDQRSGSAETPVSYDSKCLCSAHVQPWNPHVPGGGRIWKHPVWK